MTTSLKPRQAFDTNGKRWRDPQWKTLPPRLFGFVACFTQLVPCKDIRQKFLMEDLLHDIDDGATVWCINVFGSRCWVFMLLARLNHVETSILVPLKHILPQKFTNQLLTMRKIDQLPRSTEASVPPDNQDDDAPTSDEPEDPLDHDHQPGYSTGPDSGDNDDQENIIPDIQITLDNHLMMLWICQGEFKTRGNTRYKFPINSAFKSWCSTWRYADPGQDDDHSQGPDPASEPSGALSKAKPEVIIKRPKVQLPGNFQPISVPVPKDDFDEEDAGPSHDRWSFDSMSTTTPASFVPGEHAQPAQQKPPQGTPEIFHHKKMMMKRNHTMTEEETAQL